MFVLVVFNRRHYADTKYLQLMERLVDTLYPAGSELEDSMSPKIVDVYEMVVSHSAFLPSLLSRTLLDVKGKH